MGNRISCVGASAFAKTLKTNCTLTHLDLSDNVIGDSGATELALAIKDHNNTLRSLNLHGNCSISIPVIESLQQADDIVAWPIFFVHI